MAQVDLEDPDDLAWEEYGDKTMELFQQAGYLFATALIHGLRNGHPETKRLPTGSRVITAVPVMLAYAYEHLIDDFPDAAHQLTRITHAVLGLKGSGE